MSIQEVFNNREIATFVWLIALLAYVLKSRDVRKSLKNLLVAVGSAKLLLPILVLAAYITGCVYVLEKASLWNNSLSKDTIFWFCSVGLITVYKFIAAQKGGVPVKELLLDNLKFIVLLEFILNTFPYSLWAELVIVPIVTIVVMMNAYVEASDGSRDVRRLLGSIQTVLGLIFVGHALYLSIVDYRTLGTIDTLRGFLLPILLSIAIVPVAYLFAVYTNYESLFGGFKSGKPKDESFIRYCKWRVVFRCGLSTKKIGRLRRFDLMHLTSKEDVTEMLRQRLAASPLPPLSPPNH